MMDPLTLAGRHVRELQDERDRLRTQIAELHEEVERFITTPEQKRRDGSVDAAG